MTYFSDAAEDWQETYSKHYRLLIDCGYSESIAQSAAEDIADDVFFDSWKDDNKEPLWQRIRRWLRLDQEDYPALREQRKLRHFTRRIEP